MLYLSPTLVTLQINTILACKALENDACPLNSIDFITFCFLVLIFFPLVDIYSAGSNDGFTGSEKKNYILLVVKKMMGLLFFQEEYMVGDEMGMLGCEHRYHVECIRQWLRQKNWCPICKASAAPSGSSPKPAAGGVNNLFV